MLWWQTMLLKPLDLLLNRTTEGQRDSVQYNTHYPIAKKMIYKKHRIVILAHFASPGKTFWLRKVRVRCWLKCCLSGCDMSFPSFWGPNVQESTCFGDLISKKRPFGCRHIPWLISKNTTMMVFCSAVLSTFCWLDWQVSLTNLHNLANRIININEDNDVWCKNSHKHYGLKYVSLS